ncbi:hypothetical protein [Crocosphaera sp.]|uniref:hypothetical protein n=1 Tax=Crocosphaera sp. TaxID=2729996 RepID=UPI003F225350|nr:hypothetical protein [Crocosphaera sp.]
MKESTSKQEFAIIPTVVSGSQETAIIQFLKTANQLLEQSQTLAETQEVWQTVNALEALSKKFRLNKEVQLDATELRIRIERRLGEFLTQNHDNNEVRNSQDNQKSAIFNDNGNSYQILSSNHNFSKHELSKFQQLAKTPQKVFEAIVTDLRIEATINRQTALSTLGILRAIRNEQKKDNKPLFSPIIKPSDNWNFSSIRYKKIDNNSGKNRGYIPGEIYANCFWYYVKPNNLVVAPMAGSGQIWRIYEVRQEWMGQHIYDFELKMFDLTPRGKYQHLIKQHDLLKNFPIPNPDYIIMDIPYYGMANQQYSDKSEDLANMSLDEWKESLAIIAKNCANVQKAQKLCTVISPNYRDVVTGQIFMVTDMIRALWESFGYQLYDKAYSSRRIQQNQTPSMARMNNKAKANRIMLTDITEILTFQKL